MKSGAHLWRGVVTKDAIKGDQSKAKENMNKSIEIYKECGVNFRLLAGNTLAKILLSKER